MTDPDKSAATMKAVLWTAYGPPEVLKIGSLPIPEPGPGEIRLRVTATSAFAGDAELRQCAVLPLFWLPVRLYIGLFKPARVKVLGQEFVGVVDALGEGVDSIRVGDRIVAPSTGFGTSQQFLVMKADAALARLPTDGDFDDFAGLPVGGLNAQHFHRLANISAGEEVLMVGAGGSIGTIALQLAKQAGARVTVVDTGSDKLARLKELGADVCIDYRQQSLASIEQRFDVVFNITLHSSFADGVQLLKPRGRLLLMNMFFWQMLRGLFINLFTGKRVIVGMTGYDSRALQQLVDEVLAGRLQLATDRYYDLDAIVEAHRYVDSGDKFGNVIIRVD